MFETLKDIGKLAHLAQRAQQMQQQMKQVQEELASERITGDAGGRVTATVSGRLELISIRIDPSRVDTANIELLQDLITAAVSSAQYKATQLIRERMDKVANELGITRDMLPGGGM